MKTAPIAKLKFLQQHVPGLPAAVAQAVAAHSTWSELGQVVNAARAEMGLPSIVGLMEV